jgi:hypothetical protein
MSLTANRVTRATVVWDTNVDYTQYTLRPSADIDAFVTDPFGNVVAGSGSWDNTYEMIEFVAPVTGVYTLRINKFSCAAPAPGFPDTTSPKALGWAWYHDY